MTVKELRAQLYAIDDQDKEVYFVYDYGDHCHTQVAKEVCEVSEGDVRNNSYIDGKSVAEGDEDECGVKTEEAVLIR
jgi:hypothetical protein